MLSAFGVEHGELAKSYTQIRRSFKSLIPKSTDSMDRRIRVNYSQFRHNAGSLGSREQTRRKLYAAQPPSDELMAGSRASGLKNDRIKATKNKKAAQAMVEAAQARSKRAGRKLP